VIVWAAILGVPDGAAVSGKMDAMSGEEKKSLKWVMAGAGRDLSYMENGYQYVIRCDKEYTLLQKTRSGEINRRQVCATKQQAYELAERWAAEAVLSR
jgi:hypothetical protein